MDQAIRRMLEYDKDLRQVVADPKAPYYGVQLSERSLVPEPGARLGPTRFDWWLTHVPPPLKATTTAPVAEHTH
jgi:hypothetical protein